MWLLLTAAALLTVTLLGPALTIERDVFRHLLVFDITQSMQVRDAEWRGQSVSRLELAKQAAIQSLPDLPCGSSVGLGIFTGHRTFALSTPVEVCTHYGELTQMIAAVDWRMAWVARSEVAKGIHSGLLATRKMGREARLIFLTDGHEAPPIHADFRPEFKGEPGIVRGAIAGLGGLMPVPIPKLDSSGNQRGFWNADEVLQIDPFTLGRSTSVPGESMIGVDQSVLLERLAGGTKHLSSLREAYLGQLARELQLAYRRIQAPRELSELLVSPQFAVRREAQTDLRWVAGLGALIALAAVYLWPATWRARAR